MKKIVIFGSTDMTGLCALEHATQKNLQVTAFVRDETKIPDHIKDKVKIIIGDVTNDEDVDKAVKDQEGVVVVLGTRNDLKPTTVMSEGMRNIIKAMNTHNVKLVSVCLSAFLFYPPVKVPAIFQDITMEHRCMFKEIRESELTWIAVFPPHIADTPSSKYTIKHDESAGKVVSKHDLGSFLVDCLSQPEHYNKVCGIASNPQ